MMQPHKRTALLLLLALGGSARADDLELPVEAVSVPSPFKEIHLKLDGYLRTRAEVWNDLDLSRGPTPSTGMPIFPTQAGGGDGHTLTAVDMRLRFEPTIEVGQAVRLRLRVDVLDNVGWGSTPSVLPSRTTFAAGTQGTSSPEAGQNALHDAIRIKQAWGEVTLPFGILAAGRMGALVSWGTGFFINNGSCISCDYGDSGDRISLTVPLLGHWLIGLYELSSSGPYVTPWAQSIPVEPRAHVNTVALGFARYDTPQAQQRRLRAGRTLVQYGLLASYRWQDLDAPAWTQGNLFRDYGPNDFVRRGVQTFAADLWLLVHRGGFRAEVEAATVIGRIADASDAAGVALRLPVTTTQWGGVASLAYAFRRFPLRLRVEVGVASGDDAPGFGVRPPPGQLIAVPGDFDGPKVRPPVDLTIDNMRFHPDYRVDLILWRRIVGQVSGAIYLRPSLRLAPVTTALGTISAELAWIHSHALYALTAPGQDAYLGDELDLTGSWRIEPGFEVFLSYGLFLPNRGFRNVALNLSPQPAQALELILAFRI